MAAGVQTYQDRIPYHKAYYLKHKEHMLQSNKAWVRKNFESVKIRKAMHNRSRVYGLTEIAYQAMLQAQSNLCAICGDQLIKPNVDHNHKTKVVRGLLCDGCNRGLGYFKENSQALRTAADYIEKEY